MELMHKLAPIQTLLLCTAARRAEGRIILTDTLRGGVWTKTLTGLRQRGRIEPTADGHALTNAGYAAVGRQRPVPFDAFQKLDTTGDLLFLEGMAVRLGKKYRSFL